MIRLEASGLASRGFFLRICAFLYLVYFLISCFLYTFADK